MLDATQPVVLAPASVAHARSETAQSLVGTNELITFRLVRSFANRRMSTRDPSLGPSSSGGTPGRLVWARVGL